MHTQPHFKPILDITASDILLLPCSPPSSSQTWDIDNDDTSVAHVAKFSVPTSNHTVAEDIDIDKFDRTQEANQFGMEYTAEQLTETKLLKILNDAAAPGFLDQD
jgi:hypothetical protein